MIKYLTFLSTRVAIISLLFGTISACGGSSVSDTQASIVPLSTSSNVILHTRSDNSSAGIRQVTLPDGVKMIYFDADLGISEDAKKVDSMASITNSQSLVQMERGQTTSKDGWVAGGNPVTTMPTGTFSYVGTAIFDYDVSSQGYYDSRTVDLPSPREKTGLATMTIDFNTGTGSLSAIGNQNVYQRSISSDREIDGGTSTLNVNITSIDPTGNILGNGTFTQTGTAWVSREWQVSRFVDEIKNHNDINESSTFHGSVFGLNAEEAAGISMGNNHVVAVGLVQSN